MNSPTFGRRGVGAPQHRMAPSTAARFDAEPDMSVGAGMIWNDDSDVQAWKTQRRRGMLIAMGWRRWAAVACMLLGGVMRLGAHGPIVRLVGMGLGLVGVVFLWAGRKRYVDSLPSAGS